VKELNLSDSVSFESLVNQCAIHCKTEEESIKLFEYLARYKVLQSVDRHICSKDNTVWDAFHKESTTYTVANKSTVYCMDLQVAKDLGYKVIPLESVLM
jgi:hypothetical protein